MRASLSSSSEPRFRLNIDRNLKPMPPSVTICHRRRSSFTMVEISKFSKNLQKGSSWSLEPKFGLCFPRKSLKSPRSRDLVAVFFLKNFDLSAFLFSLFLLLLCVSTCASFMIFGLFFFVFVLLCRNLGSEFL